MTETLSEGIGAIPVFRGDLFDGQGETRFAIGVVATGETPTRGRELEYAAYLTLRANVYAHEMHYMAVDGLNADGTESDGNDARSIHFAVFENTGEAVRCVGAMRLILKSGDQPEPLPVERHYPEAFTKGPAPLGSAEVSHLIGRHENVRVQASIKWPLFLSSVTWALRHDIPDAYGVVEESLERRLLVDRVPLERLAPAKFVPEFNTVKLPVQVDVAGLDARLDNVESHLFAALRTVTHQFVYSGMLPRVRLT